MKHRIATGELQGRQEDWGSWAAKVTVAEIRTLMDEWFREPLQFKGAYNLELLDLVRTFVASLDEDVPYALVASEL